VGAPQARTKGSFAAWAASLGAKRAAAAAPTPAGMGGEGRGPGTVSAAPATVERDRSGAQQNTAGRTATERGQEGGWGRRGRRNCLWAGHAPTMW